MLETKNLVKIYKPKKGIPVTALNKISLKFPEKGMVFLLGKSGSGKSTLLNVLGGLDNYNDGEIIIKGVSSKNFKQQHFDSYRNTYVGFIFQEYNILDEFTVGANIALAIELQSRKASDEEINAILKDVDLEGYGDRKPNELSGGQKQRVAIARALVKNPEIIMADEPTGALDSNTGKQVLDTLKKLSADKLVIVVSHDREFAEKYADRIIELSDGEVISDVEVSGETEEVTPEGISFYGRSVEVTAGYHLTEEDRIAINEYIDKLKSGSLEIAIAEKRSSKRFVKTDVSKIRTADGSGFKLIKSKLPMKNAFKIGAGGLKHKKIRLAITILLSCVSFGLFGLADTFGSYDHVKTCTNSLYDTGINYVSAAKSKKVGSGVNQYWRDYGYGLSDKDLKNISDNSGVHVEGVYVPLKGDFDFSEQTNPEIKLTETDYNIYQTYFSGFTTINDNVLKATNYKLIAGVLPNGAKDEIAISEYIFEVLKKAEYFDGVTKTKNKNGEEVPVYQKITKAEDIIGKQLILNDTKYTVTAVVDTGFDIDRYVPLTEKKEGTSKAETLVDFVLANEFSSAVSYSYASALMVGDGYIDNMIDKRPLITPITEGYLWFYGDNTSVDSEYLARLEDVKNQKIIWLDGEKKSLGEKEIIVSSDSLQIWDNDGNEAMLEESTNEYVNILKGKTKITASIYDFSYTDNYEGDEEYTIVGIIDTSDKNNNIYSTVVCCDALFNKMTEGYENYYSYAIGAMPSDKEDIRTLVSYCYREDSNMRYQIQNSVTFELDAVNDALKQLSKWFLYIGLGFALFAALMLSNFIGTSIAYKKQEIGILRAIGSRSNDVFRIFFAESFIIAIINFVLSAAGVFAVTVLINYLIRNELGVLITVLGFGIRQFILLLAVSVLVAFVASFLPVKKIASKRPIDAIRNR